jgi:hypothetical protein
MRFFYGHLRALDTCCCFRRWCYLFSLMSFATLSQLVVAQTSACFETAPDDRCAGWAASFPNFFYNGTLPTGQCIMTAYNPAASGGDKYVTPECPNGFNRDAIGICKKSRACSACESKSGQSAGAAFVDIAPSDFTSASAKSYSACVDGCEARGFTGLCIQLGSSAGCDLPKTLFSGGACNPAPSGTPTPSTQPIGTTPTISGASTKPPAGKCFGVLNGVQVLVTCDRTSSTSQTITQSGGGTVDPTASGTPTGGDVGVACPYGIGAPQTNSSGAYFCSCYIAPQTAQSISCTPPTTDTVTKTITSTQSCDAAGCKSTVQTDVLTGGQTSTSSVSTSTQTGDYCKDNPSLPICKASNFGGSCTAGFICDGDAAQCASARGIWETRCLIDKFDFEVKNTALNGLGKSATDLIGDPSDHPRKAKIDKSLGSFDNTNPFASTCPPDYVFTVLGQQQTIPFAGMCSLLVLMGQLLVGLTMLASATWLVKG